jgi:hypothetical protein
MDSKLLLAIVNDVGILGEESGSNQRRLYMYADGIEV